MKIVTIIGRVYIADDDIWFDDDYIVFISGGQRMTFPVYSIARIERITE